MNLLKHLPQYAELITRLQNSTASADITYTLDHSFIFEDEQLHRQQYHLLSLCDYPHKQLQINQILMWDQRDAFLLFTALNALKKYTAQSADVCPNIQTLDKLMSDFLFLYAQDANYLRRIQKHGSFLARFKSPEPIFFTTNLTQLDPANISSSFRPLIFQLICKKLDPNTLISWYPSTTLLGREYAEVQQSITNLKSAINAQTQEIELVLESALSLDYDSDRLDVVKNVAQRVERENIIFSETAGLAILKSLSELFDNFDYDSNRRAMLGHLKLISMHIAWSDLGYVKLKPLQTDWFDSFTTSSDQRVAISLFSESWRNPALVISMSPRQKELQQKLDIQLARQKELIKAMREGTYADIANTN